MHRAALEFARTAGIPATSGRCEQLHHWSSAA